MSELEVMPFQPGQETLVAHLHNTAFSDWRDRLEPCYRHKQVTAHTVQAWNREPFNTIWIAYTGREAVGYANCRIKIVSGHRDFLSLAFTVTHPDWGQSSIGVIPAYRHQGIATILVQTILEHFKSRGGELVTAYAYNFNLPASRFFAHLGFSHQPLFYFDPYSSQTPWGFDAIYAELDLANPLQQVPLNPKVTIREPKPGDQAALVSIFRESAPFAFGSNPLPQQIALWLSNPAREAIFVAEFNGELVGTMEFFKDGVIGIPGILPQYRHRGIGTTLFYHLLKKMQSAGFRKAIGDTGIIQKEMISLYHRFGFDLSKKLLTWTKVLPPPKG